MGEEKSQWSITVFLVFLRIKKVQEAVVVMVEAWSLQLYLNTKKKVQKTINGIKSKIEIEKVKETKVCE